MATHMKTTIEIADSVLDQAKRVAQREGTTLRALVEQGLRHELARRGKGTRSFRLRDASFGGKGLQPGIHAGDWDSIRELAYRGRS
jgi:hypothetical protein